MVESLQALEESLNFLHVSELRSYCLLLSLSSRGNKLQLKHRIMFFLERGEALELPPYPVQSCANKTSPKELSLQAFILKGLYKNDLKTRLFFKEHIGSSFHFTAFGIDWIEERWMQGCPPTYQEFIDMWIKEYALRQSLGSSPKEEWAYIQFVQSVLREHPKTKKSELLRQWKEKRLFHKECVHSFFQKNFPEAIQRI